MKKIFNIVLLFSIIVFVLSCSNNNTDPKDNIVTELNVTKYNPERNAVNVSCDANLEVTFNAKVQPTAGNIYIYDSNRKLHESFSVSEDIVFNNNKIIINPKKDFKGKTSYYVHIEPMSISTEYGIFYGGINIDNFWSFTTAEALNDTTPNVMTAELFIESDSTYYFKPQEDDIHFVMTATPSRFKISANQLGIPPFDNLEITLQFPTNLELNKPSSLNCELQVDIIFPISCQNVEVTLIRKKGNEYEGRFKGSFNSAFFAGEIRKGYFKVDLE